LQKKLAQN